jgi:hypothetical protein
MDWLQSFTSASEPIAKKAALTWTKSRQKSLWNKVFEANTLLRDDFAGEGIIFLWML